MHICRLVAAWSAATLLSTAGAATPDPQLRRSEQVDTRRLDRASEDERSVLRVEWRATVAGGDEARTVAEMLDSLRRMEATVGEIGRLVRSMPAQEAVVAEAPEAAGSDVRLALAAGAALGLLALWWSRRRNSSKHPGPAAALDTTPPAGPPVAPAAVEALPTPLPAELPDPPVRNATAETRGDTLRIEPHATTAAIKADPLPAAIAAPGVEPSLELAEIMLSMGLEQAAAQALVEYSEANPRQAIFHWLKLLDIYRNSGHRKDFKETAEKLRQHFNIQAEDWTGKSADETPTLENFPRVSEHVQQIWLQPEDCMSYLRHLLEDNRAGERAGFPLPVAEEILLLIEILKQASGAAQAAGTQRSTS